MRANKTVNKWKQLMALLLCTVMFLSSFVLLSTTAAEQGIWDTEAETTGLAEEMTVSEGETAPVSLETAEEASSSTQTGEMPGDQENMQTDSSFAEAEDTEVSHTEPVTESELSVSDEEETETETASEIQTEESVFTETETDAETEAVTGEENGSEMVSENPEETASLLEIEYSEDEISTDAYMDEGLMAAADTGVEVYCMVCVDGVWTKITPSLTTSGGKTSAGRYYVTLDQLEAVYSEYGFQKAGYMPSQLLFPHAGSQTDNVWRDALKDDDTNKVNGSYIVPVGTGSGPYYIFYTPDFGDESVTNKTQSALIEKNTFYSIQVKDTANLLTDDQKNNISTEYVLTGGTKSITLPDYENVKWVCNMDTGAIVTESRGTDTTIFTFSEVTQPCVIETEQMYTITLQTEDGIITESFPNIENGTLLKSWLSDHKNQPFGDNGDYSTIGSYEWKISGSSSEIISDQAAVTQDITLVGTPREILHVKFLAQKPDMTEEEKEELTGGTFLDPSEEYTTVSVFQGGTVPETFLRKMEENLQIDDTHVFSGWFYDASQVSGSGELQLTDSMQVTADLTVYARYKTKATYTFYTDSSMTTVYDTATNIPIGSAYPYVIPEITPPDNKTLRYWVNATEGKVFTKADTVTGDAQLYPVFDRYIFEFQNRGKILISVYDGDMLNFSPQAEEGYYFSGFQATGGDGTQIIIPNGTEISASVLTDLGLSIPEAVDGKYIIQAEPCYKKQHTIIYHKGSDGQLILTDEGSEDQYTVVEDAVGTLLGGLDIANVVSPVGLALDGWAVSEEAADAGIVSYQPYQSLSEEELDAACGEDGILELWPVWAQQADTKKVIFKSNYPSGASDASGNELTEKEYTVYIKSGTKPTMPFLEKTGITEPVNTITDSETGETVSRYVIAGWSKQKNGTGYNDNNGGSATEWGTYSMGSQYALNITADETVFYAIWIDKGKEAEETARQKASFFIRLDGTLPQEPGSFSESAYSPNSNHLALQVNDALITGLNVVNDPERVSANIVNEPSADAIAAALTTDKALLLQYDYIDDARFNKITAETYGTYWWIEWYACKQIPNDSRCEYHVDGRIRFSDQVELNYHGNGGSNVPSGQVYEKDTTQNVLYTTSNNTYPTRDNFTFIGWSEDPDALVPAWYAPSANKPDDAIDTIYMNEDKDLYAVWEPVATTIPLDGSFNGRKYEKNGEEDPTAASEAGKYSFTITLVNKPEKAEAWSKEVTNKADGTFSFEKIQVKYPGNYVFEIRENYGTEDTIQYDASVYRLTVGIVSTDYGLGIGGYSVTKNGKPISVAGTSVESSVFEFTNRIGMRDITVSKVWDDKEDEDGMRPDNVVVQLLRDGKPIVGSNSDQYLLNLSELNQWTYTWKNLPASDSNTAVPYSYSVKEAIVPEGYDTETSGDMNSGYVITNMHEPVLRDVTISKTVRGNMGDRKKKFSFTAVLTDAEGNLVKDLTVSSDGQYTINENGALLFELADGDHITLQGLPPGVFLTITEESDGYETVFTKDQDETNGSSVTYQIKDDMEIEVTNRKEATLDTDVKLNRKPYVLLLAIVITGGILLLAGRRRCHEE